MAEPNPITADGLFGIFLGHTFIVTDKGHEVVDDFPLEIAVATGCFSSSVIPGPSEARSPESITSALGIWIPDSPLCCDPE
jgi:hypothetical protein